MLSAYFQAAAISPIASIFYTPMKLLPQALQRLGRAGMPAAWSFSFQCRHRPLHQRQCHPQVLPIYRDKPVASLPAFVPLLPMLKRHADETVVIALPLGAQTITFNWPVSNPDGCASFIGSLSQ